jgi:hypothetical protein
MVLFGLGLETATAMQPKPLARDTNILFGQCCPTVCFDFSRESGSTDTKGVGSVGLEGS